MRTRTLVYLAVVLLLGMLSVSASANTLTVTNLGDSGAGSLRSAIADAASGDTITFQSGLTGTISLASTMLIAKTLTIEGPGAENLAISGNGTVRVFDIITAGVLTLSGVTIEKGRAPYTGSNYYAGGIYLAGTLKAVDCGFSENSAAYGYGGAIYHDATFGTLTLINCTFTGNNAWAGGAVCNNTVSGQDTIINCVFEGNTAGYGGAYVNYHRVALTNCVFSGNSIAETYGGGAIYGFSTGVLSAVNCTFSGNKSPSMAGAIINNGGSMTLTNCIVWGNPCLGPQVANPTGTTTVSHCDVESSTGTTDGGNNINSSPLFVRDPSPATGDYGDLSLKSDSPCIDAGNDSALPADTYDLDGDGDTTEPIPYDVAGGSRIEGSAVDMGAYEIVLITPVTIDVKPGSDPARINLRNNGLLPVAVLAADEFDPTTVNLSTVRFAEASVATVKKTSRFMYSVRDVDADGDLDLLLYFDIKSLNLTSASTEAILTGQTSEGGSIQGSHPVVVVQK